jgi:predicted NACHT family NTPase
MQEVARQEEEGWLSSEGIDNFPCADLRTIDQLWVKYSHGKFGFSVQKRIYQDLGGTRNYDVKIWQAFGDKVEWRKGDKWLYYNDVTFDIKAPEGHLPTEVWGFFDISDSGDVGEWVCGGDSSLASRLEDCNI